MCVGVLSASLGLAQNNGIGNETNKTPNGKGNTPQGIGGGGDAKPARTAQGNNGISYHGGPIIAGGTHVYYIWYGNWSANTATSILTDLAGSIGGSPYFNINTTYYDGSGVHVSNTVTFNGQTTALNYAYGTSLSDCQIYQIVLDAINNKGVTAALPWDPSGVYFVLASQDVTASSGFCTQYCGWHDAVMLSNGGILKYAFIGNPARCPSACAATQIQSNPPNGNLGADAMASIISHELEESTTDPNLNAWYDSRGQENADKCAWTFGTVLTDSKGSKYNMTLGSREFLIQQNWVNASGGYCALKY